MAQQRLSTEEFFTRLATLLADHNKKGHGSITLSQKRLNPHTETKAPVTDPSALSDLHPDEPLPIIIRATDGEAREDRKKRVKISTVVQPDALDEFYARYAEACKAGMTALKKRDKSKRKKDKAKKKKAKHDAEKKG
jgi:signal recognition particle subunit SRP14